MEKKKNNEGMKNFSKQERKQVSTRGVNVMDSYPAKIQPIIRHVVVKGKRKYIITK